MAAHFVGESYDPGEKGTAADRAGRAAAELARQGRPVRHLGSLLAPEDELALHLFEADAAETVAEVGRRASVPFDRIWRAVWSSPAELCNHVIEEAT